MPEHLRLIVDLATWCQLRRAELLGLRRKDVDLDRASIQIEQSRTVTMHGKSLVRHRRRKPAGALLRSPSL
jgi:integrase